MSDWHDFVEIGGRLESDIVYFLPRKHAIIQFTTIRNTYVFTNVYNNTFIYSQVYSDKLAELRTEGEPIKQRRLEFELRPAALEEFALSIQLTNKAVDLYRFVQYMYI